MNRFSLNSWSLNELLGPSHKTVPKAEGAGLVEVVEPYPEHIRLVDLPERLTEHGIGWIDFCYFHFPSTDEAYLAELKGALERAGVGLFCLLIDFGNLTQPESDQKEREFAWISEWIRRAGFLGAKCARAVAGNARPDDDGALDRAVRSYHRLADVADEAGVRLLTENLGDFTRSADSVLELLDRLEGRVGLVADFGNGRKVGEYDDLERMVARAESIHAKPEVREDGRLEEADFTECVSLAHRSGFSGPYTIVYRGPGDPWDGIRRTKSLIEQVIS